MSSRIARLGSEIVLALAMLTLAIGCRSAATPVIPRLRVGATVLLFGDSITVNGRYGQIIQDHCDQVYPERQVRVVAAGVSGATAANSLARLRSELSVWDPDCVVINLGVNDLQSANPTQFEKSLALLIAEVREVRRDRMVVLSSFILPETFTADRQNERRFVRVIEEMAARAGCHYIPCYDAFDAIREHLPAGVAYTSDGVHPNALGHWIIAAAILKSFQVPIPASVGEIHLPVSQLHLDGEAPALQDFELSLPRPMRVRLVHPAPTTIIAWKSRTAVIVDGALNDWDLALPMVINARSQQVMGVIPASRELPSVNAWACYDESALYFAAKVRGITRSQRTRQDSMPRDCIELFVDLRSKQERRNGGTEYSSRRLRGVVQYLLSLDESHAVAAGSGDSNMLAGVRQVCRAAPGGYDLECAIPVNLFADSVIKSGAEYGIDFGLIETDRFSLWSDTIALRWSGSALSFFSTTEFARLTIAP